MTNKASEVSKIVSTDQNYSVKKLSETSYQLSCGGKCCPVVEIKDNDILISDDYNNRVQIPKAYAKVLIDALNLLK